MLSARFSRIPQTYTPKKTESDALNLIEYLSKAYELQEDQALDENCIFLGYLLLTTSYTLILLVMAMEVTTSVYVLKSDSLVLLPCLPAPFDY